MFSPDGEFAPASIPDPRVRAVLVRVVLPQGGRVTASDLFAAAVRTNDPVFGAMLTIVAPQGTVTPSAEGPGEARPRNRRDFTPSVRRALDEYTALARQHPTGMTEAGVELLLHRALVHLPSAEGGWLRPLDLALLRAMLHRKVTAVAGAARTSPADVDEGPLPAGVGGAIDLTARTQSGDDRSPFDGTAYEVVFDTLSRSLHRRHRRHVFLVGERGVGLPAVVAELARRGRQGQPPFLRELRVVLAGARHTPPEEARACLGAILAATAGGGVIAVEGFAALLAADRGAKGAILAALPRGEGRLVGLLTPREYDELVGGDPDYRELFTRIDVPEPEPEVAVGLVRQAAGELEAIFGVRVDDAAVACAVRLTAEYVPGEHLPGKAVAILHQVCEDVVFDSTQRGVSRAAVGEDDVVRAVADTAGVPEETLRGVAARADYEHRLGEAVFGQPRAVRVVAAELGLIKAGMTDPTKPAGVFLFLGQTGTGKTELAKAVAGLYSASRRLRTYALGNCVEPHSVSTLVGVPPGYVGHDQGGRLVNELNGDPYGVFLLDEADKAHPDVLQPLLNLFDEGWLADQRGVRAYAGKSIFVLTSNVGQRMVADWFAQGMTADEVAVRVKEALPQIRHPKMDRPVFAPEFLARVKRVVVFQPLGREAMAGIAGKLVREVQRVWAVSRGKRLEVPGELVAAIGERAHGVNEAAKGREGGRVVRRLVADWVESPVQRELTRQPDAYRSAATVELSYTAPAGDGGEPEVRVTFASG